MVDANGQPELAVGHLSALADQELHKFTTTETQFALLNGNFSVVAGVNPRRVAIAFGVANGPAAEVTTLNATIVPAGIQFGIGILLSFNFQFHGVLPGKQWKAAGTATGSVLTVWETFIVG